MVTHDELPILSMFSLTHMVYVYIYMHTHPLTQNLPFFFYFIECFIAMSTISNYVLVGGVTISGQIMIIHKPEIRLT